jgi:hypothetical protein
VPFRDQLYSRISATYNDERQKSSSQIFVAGMVGMLANVQHSFAKNHGVF